MENDGPRVLPIESGTVRIQQFMGAERAPAYIGFACGAMLCFLALYGQWGALKGLWLCAIWHGIAVLMFRRDPQYWAIFWQKVWVYPWPVKLYAAPGVCARKVPIEASCPVRGEAGLYGD